MEAPFGSYEFENYDYAWTEIARLTRVPFPSSIALLERALKHAAVQGNLVDRDAEGTK